MQFSSVFLFSQWTSQWNLCQKAREQLQCFWSSLPCHYSQFLRDKKCLVQYLKLLWPTSYMHSSAYISLNSGFDEREQNNTGTWIFVYHVLSKIFLYPFQHCQQKPLSLISRSCKPMLFNLFFLITGYAKHS